MMDVASVVVSIVSSVVSAMLVWALKAVIADNRRLKDERAKRDIAFENGLRQLLSVRLEELYDQYEDCDTIPRRAYDRWMKLHNAYKELHGNGTFDHMKEEIEEKHITKS